MREVIELRCRGRHRHHKRENVHLTDTGERVARRAERPALPADARLNRGASAEGLLKTAVQLRDRGSTSFTKNARSLLGRQGRLARLGDLLSVPLRQKAQRVNGQAVRAEEKAGAVGRHEAVAIASGPNDTLRGAVARRLIRVAARRAEEVRTRLPGTCRDLLQGKPPRDGPQVLCGVYAIARHELHRRRKGRHGKGNGGEKRGESGKTARANRRQHG